jgi:hypothetical protein
MKGIKTMFIIEARDPQDVLDALRIEFERQIRLHEASVARNPLKTRRDKDSTGAMAGH